MNIAIWAPFQFKSPFRDYESFIVETFKRYAAQSEGKITILSSSKLHLPNSSIFPVGPRPLNPVLKIWWDFKFARSVSKMKIDLFVSIGDPSLSIANIPYCVIIAEIEKLRKSHFNKRVQSIVVMSNTAKKLLINKFELSDDQISVVYPHANSNYQPLDFEMKQKVKNDYSDGNEFFLYNSIIKRKEDFINLLKSFSHFKKRQKSSFQLLIIAHSNPFFQKSLEQYRYRQDVKIITTIDEREVALITAAAYAVVLTFNTSSDLLAALNAMQSGVPVIATKDSAINEVAGDAASYAETNSIKDTGEKIMQLYTNENYRSELIEKGKTASATLTAGKSAKSLWEVIMNH